MTWLPTGSAPRPASSAIRRYRAFSSLAFSFAWVPVMYTAFTRDRGFTPDEYQTLWAMYYLTMVVAELPWGWVADRFGTRPLLVGGPLLLAVGFVVLGHSTAFWPCAVCMALTGSGHAMISGADSAYLYELVLSEGRPQDALHEESRAWIFRLLGVSMADTLGGFLGHHLGTWAAFDASVVLMLGAAAAAAGLPAVGAAVRLRPRPMAALRGLLRPGLLWIVAWYATVFVLLRVGFQLYQPTLIDRGVTDLRLHGGIFGALNLFSAAATLLVPFVFRRLFERGTAMLVLLLLATSFLGLGTGIGQVDVSDAGDQVMNWMSLLPLLALQQMGFAFLDPVGRTALNQRIDSRERASMLSAQSLLARLLFGALLFLGQWDDALGPGLGTTYFVLAAATVGAAAVLHRLHREEGL